MGHDLGYCSEINALALGRTDAPRALLSPARMPIELRLPGLRNHRRVQIHPYVEYVILSGFRNKTPCQPKWVRRRSRPACVLAGKRAGN
jgi:hypothetical protein